MKILLDENFPLVLLRRLREDGRDVEHVILLGLRGAADSTLVERLNSEPLLFLTHDQEFAELPPTGSAIILSLVTQSLPIAVRVEIWANAIGEYFCRDWETKLFEVSDDGRLVS